jgi:hypothetical protein
MIFSNDLRLSFYFPTVMAWIVLFNLFIASQSESPFIWLYVLAYAPVAFGTTVTAGWGVAEWWQNRYDARKLRKQTEAYLYDQQSFHSEGGN